MVTTDEDYQVTLPMQMTRAEAKIIYALLQRYFDDDELERNRVSQVHDALAAKLCYFITDTPLP